MGYIRKWQIALSFFVIVFIAFSCRSRHTIIKDVSLIKNYSIKEIIKYEYDDGSLMDDVILHTVFKFEEDYEGSIMEEIEERDIFYVKDYNKEYGDELSSGYLFDNKNFYMNSENVIFIKHILPDPYDRMIVINFDDNIMIITLW